MKVGDYVRTKWRITKITSLNTYCNLVVETENGDIDKDKIIKSSPNIIDLIEVGDYVNGECIDYIKQYADGLTLIATGGYDVLKKYNGIKSIVTKEQFESMEYKIGE